MRYVDIDVYIYTYVDIDVDIYTYLNYFYVIINGVDL